MWIEWGSMTNFKPGCDEINWAFPVEHLYAYLGLVSPSLLNDWELWYSSNLSRSWLGLVHLIRLLPALLKRPMLSVGGKCDISQGCWPFWTSFTIVTKISGRLGENRRKKHERMERDNSCNVLLSYCPIKKDVEGGGGGWVGVILAVWADLATLSFWSFIP